MTMHIVLSTGNRDGLVWVTERAAFLGVGHGNFSSVLKVTHLNEYGIAFSAWGDPIALEALGEFSDRVKDGRIKLIEGDQEQIKQELRNFASDVLPPEKYQQDLERKDCRGLIVATLGPRPQVYKLMIIRRPICFAIYDELNANVDITVGDAGSPANLFVRYYYPRCKKTTEELLRLGLHTMRLAKELNSLAIGEPDAWVCEKGEFRQLGTDELAHYDRLSRALDAKIFDFLQCRETAVR